MGVYVSYGWLSLHVSYGVSAKSIRWKWIGVESVITSADKWNPVIVFVVIMCMIKCCRKVCV